MFHKELVGIFMIHLHIKYHIPSSNGFLVTMTKPKLNTYFV